MKLFKNKKGSLKLLILGPVFIVVSGLIAAMLGSTMASIQSTIPATTTANNITINMTNSTLNGVTQITSQYGTIGLIMVASIIIGLIFTYILNRFLSAGGGFD